MDSDIDKILENMPFSGEGCDIEELDPACINCRKFLFCLESGKDFYSEYCKLYEGDWWV